MSVAEHTSRLGLYLISGAILAAAVIGPDLRDAQQWYGDPPADPVPPYVLLGSRDVREVSITPLSGPRILPPTLCGRYAVPGVWSRTPSAGGRTYGGTYWGDISDGIGGLAVEVRDGIWQRLRGSLSYTGYTSVSRAALSLSGVASRDWRIGRSALLCIDSDDVSGGDEPFTAPADLALTYSDGTGMLYVDGPLTVTPGATITITAHPPYHPITLVEAAGGISGSFAAGIIPVGYSLIQDSHFVRLDVTP